MEGVCNKNAVLFGLLDYYCLVCEKLFQNIEDVHQHVDTPQHNKLLLQTSYVSEYTKDSIRKLKRGYFCEYCNEAFTTSTKMRSHLEKETHVYRRNSNQFSTPMSALNLSWCGNRVIVSELVINEKPWNGILNDDTCLVCDEEIESTQQHKTLLSHVLKIAQAKIVVGKDELSRKINDCLYQCLVCNAMCTSNDYIKHHTTDTHIKNYIKAIQYKPISKEVDDADQASCNVETKDEAFNTKEKQVPPPTNKDVKQTKKEPSDQKHQINDGGDVAKSFAKLNKMTYDEGNNTATCNICKVKLPFYLKNMKEHVNGNPHKKNVMKNDKGSNDEILVDNSNKNNKTKVTGKKPYKTMPFQEYFDGQRVTTKKNFMTNNTELVINGEIYIGFTSFIMIIKDLSEDVETYTCLLCDKQYYTIQELEMHLNSDIVIDGITTQHETAIRHTLVVTDFKDKKEFIREVRPGLFHCGYCNISVTGWDNLNFHLNTPLHYYLKMEAGRKADQIMQESDRNDQLKAFHFMRLLNMF